MRGWRAKALAISTICRRDSGRSLTGAIGCTSSAPARARASSAICRWRFWSIMPKRIGGSLIEILSATERCGISDNSWKMQAMPPPVGSGRRREFDLAPLEHHFSFVRLDHAGHHFDQCRFAGAVLAENGVNAPCLRLSGWPSRALARLHRIWRRPPCGTTVLRPTPSPHSIKAPRGEPAAPINPRIEAGASTRSFPTYP